MVRSALIGLRVDTPDVARRRWLQRGLALACAPAARHAHAAPAAAAGHVHAAVAAPGPAREFRYALPPVELVDHRGRRTRLPAALDDGRGVLLNFIYTSCRSVCPLMARTFVEVQDRLGTESGRVHMVSISIDPEYDAPARLADYARSLGAGPQWDFFTGTLDASVAVQRAFDTYLGDKMNHTPATFLRGPGGSLWTRLDGLTGPLRIVTAYLDLAARCTEANASGAVRP